MVKSAAETASSEIEVVVYIDDDDLESVQAAQRLGIRYCLGERMRYMSDCYSVCADSASGDILMYGGDDVVFRTPGWDKQVIDAFDKYPDKLILVHGDDGYWGESFGTHGFLHRRWCDIVGYLFPPYFSCDWSDAWVNDVANCLGRRVYVPFVTEHMHPSFGKATWDDTHKERLARATRDNVGKLYERLAYKRQEDVEKLRARMNEDATVTHDASRKLNQLRPAEGVDRPPDLRLEQKKAELLKARAEVARLQARLVRWSLAQRVLASPWTLLHCALKRTLRAPAGTNCQS